MGAGGRSETGREWDSERQTGRANRSRACVMLSDVRVVLIQVNPARTYTNGGRAQPSSYSVIPYGWQIKG